MTGIRSQPALQSGAKTHKNSIQTQNLFNQLFITICSFSWLFFGPPAAQAATAAASASHPYTLHGPHQDLACALCHNEMGDKLSAPPFHVHGCAYCHKEFQPDSPRTDCLVCHQSNRPKDTTHNLSPEHSCLNCHQLHFTPVHYGPHCAACHLTDSWQSMRKDALKQAQCVDCHHKDRPRNHHNKVSDCVLCHQQKNWQEALFKHHGFEQCTPCHQRPARHQHGDCDRCHTIDDWNSV